MRKAKEKFQNRIQEELEQPYTYRDKVMILSENLIIFDDFYTSIWKKITQIGLAIHLINVGSNQNAKINGIDSVMLPKQKCQIIQQSDTLDNWNDKLENLNNISMMRQSIN